MNFTGGIYNAKMTVAYTVSQAPRPEFSEKFPEPCERGKAVFFHNFFQKHNEVF